MKDDPFYGLKEHAAVDVNHGFILATTLTPASVNDTNYLGDFTAYSSHTKQPINKAFADKAYAGKPNRNFLALNVIADGIMRKIQPRPSSLNWKLNGTRKSPKFDILPARLNSLWDALHIPLGKNSSLESVICMMEPKELGLPPSPRIKSIVGADRQLSISQRV